MCPRYIQASRRRAAKKKEEEKKKEKDEKQGEGIYTFERELALAAGPLVRQRSLYNHSIIMCIGLYGEKKNLFLFFFFFLFKHSIYCHPFVLDTPILPVVSVCVQMRLGFPQDWACTFRS